jgi:hypothetical protein
VRSTKTLSDGYQAVIHQSIGSNLGPSRSSIYLTKSTEAGGRRLDADSFQVVKTSTLSKNEWVIAGSIHNYGAATLSVFKNGIGTDRAGGFQTTGNTPATDSKLVAVGGTTVFTEYLGGEIAEVIIYNTGLTTNQRQEVETYLNNKWGIY